ncbi:MAG: GerAB/ArcD/ProY family transporter, partial [Christensenellales bacterium]
MLDEKLTAKQIQMLLSMFIFGSSAVIGVSNAIGQDSWISLIFAALIAMPVILMYARIVLLNPDRQIFEIFESHFGKVAGKVASALMTWYAIHLGALVVRNFAEFIQISALLETPHLAVTILIFLTVCSLARYGGKALGKWSVIILPIVLGIVIITVFLSLNILEINHMLPVWERRTGEIIQDAFQVFSFPYAEIVMILGIADLINVRDKPHVIFMKSALTSTGILMMITLRNILV